MQLRELGRIERHVAHAGCQNRRLLDADAVETCNDRSGNRGGPTVLYRDVCRIGTRQRQMSNHVRITQVQRAGGFDLDVLPDAGVAVANSRNPVPALGGDEGGPVNGHRAAVVSGAGRHRLLVRYPWMGRRRDAHGNRVEFTRSQDARDVERASGKRTADLAQAPAVQPDLRRVVDALEDKGEVVVTIGLRRREHAAVPVVLAA